MAAMNVKRILPARLSLASFLLIPAVALVLAPVELPARQAATYDLLLINGRVVDGTGSPWYRADVAISGDTIARIAARIDPTTAARVIDVAGAVVAPGFIDTHTHARRGINADADGRRTTCARA